MYYIDVFLKEIVKEKDPYAPPERYIEYREGIFKDIIIETYIASYNPLRLIDFAYSVYEDRDMLPMKRSIFFKMHNVSNDLILHAYTVPPQWYELELQKLNE